MIGRAVAVVLVGALLVSGCSVARLPETAATREQTATQHRLDVADCKAEVGYRHNYNGDDSPLANALRNVFVLGTSGAGHHAEERDQDAEVAMHTAHCNEACGACARHPDCEARDGREAKGRTP